MGRRWEATQVSKERILIVDDSENIRTVLQLNFESLGYVVMTAKDGEEALRLIEAEKPDVVILDVMMPRQNGFQVCRKIKSDAKHAATPVIFLTAKGNQEDRFWGKDCGADEYLTKPFSAAELERVIERLLARRRGTAALGWFEGEAADRRNEGQTFMVLTLTFDAKALNIFRQKYGEFRFAEAVDGIHQTVEVIIREESGDPVVWMAGDNVLKTMVPGEPERAAALRDRIVIQTDLLLKSFYDEQDAGRGFVIARVGPEGREMHVPLLTAEATLAMEAAQ